MIFELAKDFQDAVSAMPRAHPKHRTIELLEEAIRRDIQFIDQHPNTLFQCMWNLCWWYDCPHANKHYVETDYALHKNDAPLWFSEEQKLFELMELWRKARENKGNSLWARALRPPAFHLGSSQRRVLLGHEGIVRCVIFSPDGQHVVSASTDKTVRIWQVLSGKQLMCLKGHSAVVNGVAYSPDGTTIVTASGECSLSDPKDNSVRIWDAQTGEQICCLAKFESPVKCIVFSPDGLSLVCVLKNGVAKVWDLATGKEKFSLGRDSAADWWKEFEFEITTVCYSYDGKKIAGACNDNTVRIWNAEDGIQIINMDASSAPVLCVAFSPDSQRVAGGLENATVRIWNVDSGKQESELHGHQFWVTSVAFTSDGKRVISGGGDNTVRLHHVESGAEISVLYGHTSSVTSVACDLTGTLIASGAEDCSIRIFDTGVSIVKRILYEHDDLVLDLAISPGSRELASASKDQTVRVWDISTGLPKKIFRGHKAMVTNVAFYPENQCHMYCNHCLISGSEDKTVRIWNIDDAEELVVLHGHREPVFRVGFYYNPQQIVSESLSERFYWDAFSGKYLGHEVARLRLPFPMSNKQVHFDRVGTTISLDEVLLTCCVPVRLAHYILSESKILAGSTDCHVYIFKLEGT